MPDVEMPSPEGTAEPCLPSHLALPRLRLAHGIEVAPATLAKMATVGGGPAYNVSVRTPLYPRAELDRWAAERLGGLRRSTAGGDRA